MSAWQSIETAPKKIVREHTPSPYENLTHQYGARILACGGNCWGETIVVKWWQSKSDPAACNFLGDCGNAFRPTHWRPLPKPRK